MFDINKIAINAAFYELFETTFGEDFFKILADLRPTPRIAKLRKMKKEDLSEEDATELMNANISLAAIMKKNTSRIAYIGSKLNKKDFNCNYNDYLRFLSENDSADFFNQEFITKVWEKINADQTGPKSVKNA